MDPGSSVQSVFQVWIITLDRDHQFGAEHASNRLHKDEALMGRDNELLVPGRHHRAPGSGEWPPGAEEMSSLVRTAASVTSVPRKGISVRRLSDAL